MKRKILLTLFPLLLILASCSDPTRCDLSGCDYRKDGYYLMKSWPSGGGLHSSSQSGWSRSEHAYRGKEFCSRTHATSWYKKL